MTLQAAWWGQSSRQIASDLRPETVGNLPGGQLRKCQDAHPCDKVMLATGRARRGGVPALRKYSVSPAEESGFYPKGNKKLLRAFTGKGFHQICFAEHPICWLENGGGRVLKAGCRDEG